MELGFMDYQTRAATYGEVLPEIVGGVLQAVAGPGALSKDRAQAMAQAQRGICLVALAANLQKCAAVISEHSVDHLLSVDPEAKEQLTGDLQELPVQLGKVLWCVAEICTQLGVRMSDVGKMNIAGLRDSKA